MTLTEAKSNMKNSHVKHIGGPLLAMLWGCRFLGSYKTRWRQCIFFLALFATTISQAPGPTKTDHALNHKARRTLPCCACQALVDGEWREIKLLTAQHHHIIIISHPAPPLPSHHYTRTQQLHQGQDGGSQPLAALVAGRAAGERRVVGTQDLGHRREHLADAIHQGHAGR